MDPLTGDRVVVRYRLGAGGPADWRVATGPNPGFTRAQALSDITGVLLGTDDDALVISRDGIAETVPVAAITAIRQLSARTVRNSEIRKVQRMLSEAVPAAQRRMIDGWLVSADPESTALRAGVAVPCDFGTNAAAAGAIADWYAAHGRPARAVVPDRLLRLADFGGGPGVDYEVLAHPTAPPAEVRGTDFDERRRLRAEGYLLHHTFTLISLPPTVDIDD